MDIRVLGLCKLYQLESLCIICKNSFLGIEPKMKDLIESNLIAYFLALGFNLLVNHLGMMQIW